MSAKGYLNSLSQYTKLCPLVHDAVIETIKRLGGKCNMPSTDSTYFIVTQYFHTYTALRDSGAHIDDIVGRVSAQGYTLSFGLR